MSLESLFGWVTRLVVVRTVLFLSRQGNQFTLSAWKHGRPVRLDRVIERHQALASLTELQIRPGATGAVVPANKLTDVRLALQAAVGDRLEIAIAPDVAYLPAGTLPSDFKRPT